MPVTTRFNTEAGVRRLLSAHRDLSLYDRWPGVDRPHAGSTPDERLLYDGYVELLSMVYEIADVWWESTIVAEEEKQSSREEAIIAAFDKRLAGPASHPAVIWVVRHFWIELVGLQRSQSLSEWQRPETVLLAWLVERDQRELVRLIACMPYWPIGLDENGDWC